MKIPRNDLLLAFDIGNTMISYAVIKNGHVLSICHVAQSDPVSAIRKKLSRSIRSLSGRFPGLRRAIVCSVVPGKTALVCAAIRTALATDPLVLGKNIKVPIKNKYRDPGQVGQDRLVCAYAAKMYYGSPAVIIDFGTATTFDLVNKKGEYEGGLIVPGIRLSAETLFQKTALLPSIKNFKGPDKLIGKETRESILSGLFYGYGAMARGIIELIKKELKAPRPNVIVTGGYTDLLQKYISKNIDVVDEYLVYRGLWLLAEKM